MSQHPDSDWAGEEERSSPFDLKILLLYGVFRSKFWVLLLGAVGLVGGLIYGASKPNVYRSSGLLYYRAGMQEALTEEALLGLTPDNQRLVAPGIADEIMLLDDYEIFEELAAELTPAYILDTEVPTATDTDKTPFPVRIMHRLQAFLQARRDKVTGDGPLELAWTARHLQNRTSLEPIRSTSYIRVSYQGYTPESAQEICQRAMDAFVERHVEVYGVGSKLDEQEAKVIDARELLFQRDDDYDEYRKSCGVWDYTAEMEKNRLAIEEIQSELRSKETEVNAVNAKIKNYSQLMEVTEPLVEQTTQPVIAKNPMYAEYESRLNQLDIEEIEATARSLMEDKSDVRTTLERIGRERAAFLAKLESLPETIEVEKSRVQTVMNEQFYVFQDKLVDFEAERDALIAVVEGLRAELERAEARRELIEACQTDHESHADLMELAQREYDQQTAVLETLKKLSVREESGSANLKITHAPRLPLTKQGPNRWKPLAMGTFAGFALGVALAVLRQLLDRRVRYPENIAKGMGLKVLGVVPETRRLRGFPKSASAA